MWGVGVRYCRMKGAGQPGAERPPRLLGRKTGTLDTVELAARKKRKKSGTASERVGGWCKAADGQRHTHTHVLRARGGLLLFKASC